ncbi:MAG: type I DNA topoisomerase, partial [Alphaproteobacteria bacterium]|nr:type I DNA topoisomerase [Alphaproteobacteria bacterium]
MDVVVVESPAKAKTINKYLGDDYKVMASYGHVRDLPARDGSVRPDDDFAMTYEVDPRAAKRLADIARALRDANHLYLATDPDREGEAISWHVLEALAEKRALPSRLAVRRIAFNEITQRAVIEAMHHPRAIDMDLVNAQQARRALDYLVGFSLSPVLWRKLPGARSAGRVQSVALRLICERELEIEAFEPREYWSVAGMFRTPGGGALQARLTRLGGEKIERFSLPDQAAAARARAAIEAATGFAVAAIEARESRRHPPPPFTTSTLQQEASRKLRLGASHTMRIAQRLYEGVELDGETVGLITYMRTDGVQMADEAIAACRRVVERDYGGCFVPERPRAYRAKAKNAQEAHEAIRPTDLARRPAEVARYLEGDAARLYDLIWKRAVASQMESALIESVGIDIMPAGGGLELRATGSTILFEGFLRLYQEGQDDPRAERGDDEQVLPKVTEGDALAREAVLPSQHFTEPPPLFSEASLVKRLEELGIGRPSTYASIIDVLVERGYARLDRARFVPEDRGRLVTAFLTRFFDRYVEYGFTADLETKLDEISAGRIAWTDVMREFWAAFGKAVADTQGLRVRDVLEALNDSLGPYIFHNDDTSRDPRACAACANGRLSVKIGRYGAFVGCSNYPECRFTRPLTSARGGEGAHVAEPGPRLLGNDPEWGAAVTVRQGPYGTYLQLGEGAEGAKPKRVTVPKGIAADTITLEQASALLALPRLVGTHPETGHEIKAGIGRYGPYLQQEKDYRSLGSVEEVLTIGLNRAVAILAEPKARGRVVATELRNLGDHPEGGAVRVLRGRYGPYVTHGGTNATLPRGVTAEEITLEAALALLRERAAAPKRPPRRRRAAVP